MVKVVVAGGTSKLGNTIVKTLKHNTQHEVFILSSKPLKNNRDSETPVILVDHKNADSIKDVLENNQIHTVLSCLLIREEDGVKLRSSLIEAAAKSSVTERFALSEWGPKYPPEAVQYMPHLKSRVEAIEALKKTDLQWTCYFTGCFLDFYGLPHIKSYLQPPAFVLDIQNKAAGIPASGNEPVAFTYTSDVAKFIAASLDLPEWSEESIIIGDKVTWNEFVKLAEAARGCKFTVNYDDLEKLNKSQVTELPSHILAYPFFPKEQVQYVYAVFGRWIAAGCFDLPKENSLNAKFPHIKTLTVKEMLDRTWKDK